MPTFSTDGQHYFVSYITGPSHVFLGLAFADEPTASVRIIARPPVGTCNHGGLDADEIRKAVLAGVHEAFATCGRPLYPTTIIYVENDSPRYPLYQHCAKLIVERVAANRHFTRDKRADRCQDSKDLEMEASP